jgi:hypothetical protein
MIAAGVIPRPLPGLQGGRPHRGRYTRATTSSMDAAGTTSSGVSAARTSSVAARVTVGYSATKARTNCSAAGLPEQPVVVRASLQDIVTAVGVTTALDPAKVERA